MLDGRTKWQATILGGEIGSVAGQFFESGQPEGSGTYDLRIAGANTTNFITQIYLATTWTLPIGVFMMFYSHGS